jgi:menaquinone-dependent protoporphyrinogen oxidase
MSARFSRAPRAIPHIRRDGLAGPDLSARKRGDFTGTRIAPVDGMATTHQLFTCELPVFFATSEGQTKHIAERLASLLHGYGFDSRAVDVAGADAASIDWTGVRAALVGASLHVGRHQKAADRFVRANWIALNSVPSAFFSVSLAAASKNQEEIDAAWKLAREFPEARGWRPVIVASLAGRLAYLQYNFLVRFVVRQISKKEGGPTDTSRNHELTDWAQVEKLAHDMAAKIRERAAAVA